MERNTMPTSGTGGPRDGMPVPIEVLEIIVAALDTTSRGVARHLSRDFSAVVRRHEAAAEAEAATSGAARRAAQQTLLKRPGKGILRSGNPQGGSSGWVRLLGGVSASCVMELGELCKRTETLAWARGQGLPWDWRITAAAAGAGALEVLQYARAEGCPWNEEVCARAAATRHLHVLQWARQHSRPLSEGPRLGRRLLRDLDPSMVDMYEARWTELDAAADSGGSDEPGPSSPAECHRRLRVRLGKRVAASPPLLARRHSWRRESTNEAVSSEASCSGDASASASGSGPMPDPEQATARTLGRRPVLVPRQATPRLPRADASSGGGPSRTPPLEPPRYHRREAARLAPAPLPKRAQLGDEARWEATNAAQAAKEDCPWSAETCAAAAEKGHLDVLQWLRERGCPWNEETCARAARNGHLAVLQWAWNHGCRWYSGLCTSAAASGGHLELLQWARQEGCPWDELTCASAARGGHLELLQYAVGEGCPWDAETCAAAAGRGHLEVLCWARQNGCPWNERTSFGAAWGGHLELLRYAVTHGCPWDEYTCASAAGAGHLEVLQYLQAEGCPWNEETVASAAGHGHLEVLRWAVEQGCAWDDRAVKLAQERGFQDVAEWVAQHCVATSP